MATWVLLHGTPLTPSVWAPVAAHLDGGVLIPDCERVPAALDAQRQLATQVAATLPPGDWDVVGHSFGGQIALELALAHPDRVRSLTIVCSRDTPFPGFAAVADAVRSGEGPSVDAGLRRWFTASELAADGAAVQVARTDLAAAVDEPSAWANALAAIATYDRSADVSALNVPATLIAAGLDAVSTPEVMTAFAARLPRATLHVHDAWAHMSPFVDPAALAASLTAARA